MVERRTISSAAIGGSMCGSCGAPNVMALTRALTIADRHIEHGSALVTTRRPSKVRRPSRRAATRSSVISACAVGSWRETCLLLARARTRPSASASTAPNGASPRSIAFAASRHREPDQPLLGRPVGVELIRARSGPRSPRRGRARAMRSAGPRTAAATSGPRSASRRTAARRTSSTASRRAATSSMPLMPITCGVAAIGIVDVADDLRPVAAAAPRSLAQRLGRRRGDPVEHGPGRRDDRREPLGLGGGDRPSVRRPDRRRARRTSSTRRRRRARPPRPRSRRRRSPARPPGRRPRSAARARGTTRPPAPRSFPTATSRASRAPTRTPSCRPPRRSPRTRFAMPPSMPRRASGPVNDRRTPMSGSTRAADQAPETLHESPAIGVEAGRVAALGHRLVEVPPAAGVVEVVEQAAQRAEVLRSPGAGSPGWRVMTPSPRAGG